MKVSRNWLQKYFEKPLPDIDELSNALTFHAFEIEEVQGDMLDVKVLPNRAADCLCHRGIARELSAILDLPLARDPLREPLPMWDVVRPTPLTVEIEDPKKCLRYIGAVVRGVKVRPSPEWLREALEAVGQRSINNIVDATNYVMLNIGQPLHAFDAAKLAQKDGVYRIGIRNAKESEKMTTLSNEEFSFTAGTLLITDANTNSAIGIAGVKGGNAAEVMADTTDLIIESANFDGTSVRRTAQSLKLFTEASARFQNRPSPDLAAYGMRDVLALITEVAGGEIVGVVDEYPTKREMGTVSVSTDKVNAVLGSAYTDATMQNVFNRLGLPYVETDGIFTVTPPFERTDLSIPEDIVEEVGRIEGYEDIKATELPPLTGAPDQARYRGIERMKDQLIEQGFTEVSTQSFAKKGDVTLANPLDKTKPALRTSLEENLQEALVQAKYHAPLVLAPSEKPKLFEVGTVFSKEGEHLELRMTERVPAWGEDADTVDNLSVAKLEDYGKDYMPKQYKLAPYKAFSMYPFIVRDIALWIPTSTNVGRTTSYIRENAGELLVRLDSFDTFEKEGRVSYAFRLVFQSMERTLTDEEVNSIMGGVSEALAKVGYTVR